MKGIEGTGDSGGSLGGGGQGGDAPSLAGVCSVTRPSAMGAGHEWAASQSPWPLPGDMGPCKTAFLTVSSKKEAPNPLLWDSYFGNEKPAGTCPGGCRLPR